MLEHVIVPDKAVKYKVKYVINPTRKGTLYLTDFYTGR